jgi:uncharacterized protein HemX
LALWTSAKIKNAVQAVVVDGGLQLGAGLVAIVVAVELGLGERPGGQHQDHNFRRFLLFCWELF